MLSLTNPSYLIFVLWIQFPLAIWTIKVHKPFMRTGTSWRIGHQILYWIMHLVTRSYGPLVASSLYPMGRGRIHWDQLNVPQKLSDMSCLLPERSLHIKLIKVYCWIVERCEHRHQIIWLYLSKSTIWHYLNKGINNVRSLVASTKCLETIEHRDQNWS